MKFIQPELSTVIFVLCGLSVIFIPIIIFTSMFFRRGSNVVLVSTYLNDPPAQVLNNKLRVKINRISYHQKTTLRKSSRWFTGNSVRPGFTQFDGTIEIVSSKSMFPSKGLMKIEETNGTSIERPIRMELIGCSSTSSQVSKTLNSELHEIKFSSRFPTNLQPSIKESILKGVMPPFEININKASSVKNCEDVSIEDRQLHVISKSFSIGNPKLLKYYPYKTYEFEKPPENEAWTEWVSAPQYGDIE